jgi:uncharacterized membrane-anchored protein
MRFSHSARFISYLPLFTLLMHLWVPILAADDPASAPAKVKIDWVDGPVTARLGDIGEIKVRPGYRFTGKDGTRKFLELTQNPPSGSELGTIIPVASGDDSGSEFWFVIFEFNEVGYVKDDDRDKLDADALLRSIKDNTEESNKERANRGWPPYHVTGWYMNADLVLDPNLVNNVVPDFENLLSGFSFLPGSAYAEFRPGDKVAKYGLATLVAGGATAIAVKTGLFAKLWKVIVAAIAALAAFIKRAWNYLKRVLSGKAADETPQTE